MIMLSGGKSQEGGGVDKRFVSVQKRSDSLEGPQKV